MSAAPKLTPKEARETSTVALFGATIALPDLRRVIQRGREIATARITFVLDDGREIRLSGADVLWSQATLNRELGIAAGVQFTPKKQTDWLNIVGALITDGIEVQEVEGERFVDQVEEWLSSYGDAATHDRSAIERRHQFIDEDGLLNLSAAEFTRFISREFNEHVSNQKLREALTDMGFQRVTHNLPRDSSGRRSSVSYYRGQRPGEDA